MLGYKRVVFRPFARKMLTALSTIGANTFSRSGKLLQLYQRSTDQVSQSLERLSTGKRINRASDDPSGFIAAEGLRGDLVELRAQSKVASAGKFRVRQQQSALGEIQSVLNNVRGNLVSAADGLNSEAQTRALQLEIDASLDAIDQIANYAEGVDGSASLSDLREGGKANVVDGDISAATELIDAKISAISTARAASGAYERTNDALDRLREDQIVITAQTLSQIEDANFAEEVTNLVQGQILSEAAIAALAFSTRGQAELLDMLLEGLDEEA